MVDTPDEHNTGRSSEAAILSAAEKIFVAKGFEGARMQEIADAAGINKAMLHYYFRSKDRLFREVFRDVLQRTLPPLMESLASELPLGLKIRRFVESFTSTLNRRADLAAFILSELNRDPSLADASLRSMAAPIWPVLRRQIEEAASTGRIRSVEPEELLTTLLSLCVFPYVARPFVQAVCDMDSDSFEALLTRRGSTVTTLVFAALAPRE